MRRRCYLCLLAYLYILTHSKNAIATGVPVIVRHPHNTTALVGRRHTLPCRATGDPEPRVAWQHGGQPLERRGVSGHRHVTRTGGLRFQPLRISDTGFYRCVARNEDGATRSHSAYLLVQAPVEIVDGPTDRYLPAGTETRLTCTAAGVPSPRLAWYHDGHLIMDVEPGRMFTKSILVANVTQTSTFECRAQNEHLEGITIRSQAAIVTVIEEERVDRCATYTGAVCRSYLGDRLVFVAAAVAPPGEEHVRRLRDGVLASLRPSCRRPALRLACHLVFPDCHVTTAGRPAPRPLCREHCELVRDRLCGGEWAVAKAGDGQTGPRPLSLPDCSQLPSALNGSELCSSAKWLNALVNVSAPVLPAAPPAAPPFTLETAAVVCAVTVVSLSLLSLISLLCCRLRSQYRRLSHRAANAAITSKLPSNACYHQRPAAHAAGPLAALECARDDIVYVGELGEGAFGRVFAATTPALGTVAVKMLRADAAPDTRENFVQQAALLAALRHAHVVRLCGVCTRGPAPACMLLEHMAGGALNDWLAARRPRHYIRRDGDSDGGTLDPTDTPDVTQQLRFVRHVAAAMTYLSDLGYVHRDLATRNCLVSADLTVKIGDFGLARHAGTPAAAGAPTDAVPVRWLPLEALLHRHFTPESDVWAFGVLAWEVFAYARQPYAGLTPEQVVQYVGGGGVLACPDGTPRDAYDMMRLCWSRRPQHRPPFPTLLRFTTALLDEEVSRARNSAPTGWGSLARMSGGKGGGRGSMRKASPDCT